MHMSIAGFAEFYAAGGVWMHPITLTSVFVWAIAIERIYMIYFRFNINAPQLMAQVQKLILANNIDRGIKLCNSAPRAALPRVIKAALTRANKGEEEIGNALDAGTWPIGQLGRGTDERFSGSKMEPRRDIYNAAAPDVWLEWSVSSRR